MNGIVIPAKFNGIDLFTHSEAVKDTAFIFNIKGNFNLDIEIIKWICIMHDLGKANPLFQTNMSENNFDKVCRHEISSILFIDIVPEKYRDVVALTILSHHKSVNNDKRSLFELFNEHGEEVVYKNHINNISEWGAQIQKYLLYHYNIKIDIPKEIRCKEILNYYYDVIENLDYGISYYRGLLMMADHFASCFENAEERLYNIEKLFEIPNVSYYTGKNEKYPLSLIDSQLNKRHTLCIAPTGVGKTNFMLKRTKKRVFYTLPFQASINAMYKRINKDLNGEYLVGLKHSSYKSISFIDTVVKELSSLFGLPIKIITPFQIMTCILRTKGYESIVLDLKGNDIIFDELHTYDDIAKSYILYMIKFLVKECDCNIHICTATMPTWLQQDIIEILGENNTQIVKLDNKTLDSFDRHIIHIKDNLDVDLIKKHYSNGEKILIVKNQVQDAINTYKKLLNEIPDCKIMNIHSRYKRSDRIIKENQLLDDFNLKNEPCIVVSTQVVEVSIDINFDTLFTDNADIMSLIQRFGRINRQRNHIGVLKDIFIIKNTPFNNNPYSETICAKTFKILSSYNNKVLKERDLQKIIDYVHPSKNKEQYNCANPYDENEEWKQKLYSNVNNTSIAKELNFQGYIGILESEYEKYLKSNDTNMEIPISKQLRGFKEIKKSNDDSEIIGYIIPDNKYTFDCGLNLK